MDCLRRFRIVILGVEHGGQRIGKFLWFRASPKKFEQAQAGSTFVGNHWGKQFWPG
jgi:hypothetical protein